MYRSLMIIGTVAISSLLLSSDANALKGGSCKPNQTTSTLKLSRDGHFRAHAIINKVCVPFLVDTGASVILMSYQDAKQAGIDVKRLKFKTPIITASGRGRVARLDIPTIRIGDVVVKNAKAAVAKRGTLPANLLGMSFIGHIREAVIRRDKMLLRK